jgi:4-amino-4-deoxy-L-arabinose transferase-like glycosyltransferase
MKALDGDWAFDEINFDYPSLPKYVMYGLGKLVYLAGHSRNEVKIGARFISALLGSTLVFFSYKLTRKIGGTPRSSLLAVMISFTSSELLLNSSFAHNDIYLALFVTLTTFALLRYNESNERGWIYLSCLLIGMATSSKYNGLSLILVPVVLFLKANYGTILKNWMRNLEIVLISGVMLAGGYAIGTPKSVLWMAYYAKRAVPAITNHAVYGWQPGMRPGFIIQWQALNSALGWPLFVLFFAAVIFFLYKIIGDKNKASGSNQDSDTSLNPILIILLVLFAYDLPILFSYNVQPRFFTSMVPLIAALSAMFIENLNQGLAQRASWGKIALGVVCGGVLIFNGLRSTGLLLTFRNDQRIPASEFLLTLPEKSRIEYTLYPPNVVRSQFSSAHNYPIIFLKFPDQEIPTSPYFKYNNGEEGINERQPDYLIIDNFTYARFSDEYICQIHEADCAFFEKLLAGEADYELIEVFEYALPGFIPEVNTTFINPDIRVYQRTNP